MYLGGEAVTPAIVNRAYSKLRKSNLQVQVVNCYGPTEATIAVSYKLLGPTEVSQYASCSIGQPIYNIF